MNLTLYDVEIKIGELFEEAEQEELTEERKKEIEDELSQFAQLEKNKIDGMAYYIEMCIAKAAFHKEQSQLEAQKAKVLIARVDRLKALYKGIMTKNKIKKIQGDRYTMSLRATKSVHLSCPPESLPEEYQRVTVTVEPDKKKLKDDIEKNGVVIDHVSIVESQSLVIK